jgi:tetratricopeptide (TPR) repeat protein
MAKLARLPANDRAADTVATESPPVARVNARYYAFLSYSHRDEALAEWLHGELEEFRVPSALIGKLTANGIIPKRLMPIFRDEHELAAADDLGEEIQAALAHSQFLIVLCSPEAAQSRWTNAEIEAFKRSRPDGCVLAAIAAGEPFASEMPGREAEECFPPALRQRFDRRGRPTGKRAEPLAADLRENGEGRRIGFLKLVAGMLGVGLDDLVQRETTRRHRRLAWLTAASIAGMAVTSTLAFTAIQGRDSARDQRREAESLVAFMLGDLKDKLEPIGRLDALDGVGSRVLAYYSKQDTKQLSDVGLAQRSRALNLMGQVAYERGNLQAAQRLYREATLGTAEAINRNPDDPQRLYDHAQNIFWSSEIARVRGDAPTAETGMREYKRLADQMVALDSDNMKWRMERQNAESNLGIFLLQQRRFPEATQQLARALRSMEGLTAADPGNNSYRESENESRAWFADSLFAAGQIDEAIAQAQDQIVSLRSLLSQTRSAEYRQRLVPAERTLGEFYFFRGRLSEALGSTRAAVSDADALVSNDPANGRWRYYGARARLNLSEQLLAQTDWKGATAAASEACSELQRLLATDQTDQRWKASFAECWIMRSRIAIAAADPQAAQAYARKAVETAKSIKSTDAMTDRYTLAVAYRVDGDVRRLLHDDFGARTAWQAGLALVSSVAEKPNEMAEHARLLERTNQLGPARALASRLAQMGYRELTSGRG